MRKKYIFGGLLLGAVIYLYLLFLLSLSLFLFSHQNIISGLWNQKDLFFAGIGLLLIMIFSVFRLYAVIKSFNNLINYAEKNRINELMELLLFSALLVFLFYILQRENLFLIQPRQSAVLILVFIVFGSFSFKKIFDIFTGLLLLNVLYPDSIGAASAPGKEYQISGNKEFLEKAKSLINQAKRFNFDLGIIILFFPEMNSKKDINHQRFLKKQVNFLLLQNSRNYEPWGIEDNNELYVKLITVKNKKEVINASERFFSIIKQHPFYILHKPIKMDFRMLGVYLKKSRFDTDKLNFINEFLLILNQNYELIRSMEEDLKIIDVE